jgi:hypothetical protein
MNVLQKSEKTVIISYALGLNEITLHIIHHSAAKLKDNVDSRSPVSTLNIADDQNKNAAQRWLKMSQQPPAITLKCTGRRILVFQK